MIGESFSAPLTTVNCFCRTPRQSITPGRGRGGGIGAGQDNDEEKMEVSQPPTAAEPVKPVSTTMDKLVEEEEEEEGKMEIAKNSFEG